MPTFLQVALNGDSQHPAAPHTPEAIAQAALAVIHAGADSVHVHAFNTEGKETLRSNECGQVIRAIRALCPNTPISLTTSASIVSDPVERLRLIEEWDELPDLITANQGEPGIVELCEHLLARGVAIEAGLLTASDAHAFAASGLAAHCKRVLIEPLDLDPRTAVEHAATMERIITDAGIQLPQVHHGYGIACWQVNQRALSRGHGIRTGLEDIGLLPDGTEAANNLELTLAALAMMKEETTRAAY